MKKKLVIASLINLLLSAAAYAEINSISKTREFTRGEVENTKIIIITLIIVCGIIGFIFWAYKHDKKVKEEAIRNGKKPTNLGYELLLSSFITVPIFSILLANAIPHHHTGRWQSRQKYCYSNIRVIQGAVEMYNMDNENKIKFLTVSNKNNLLGYGHIKHNIPECPERSEEYYSLGDLTKNGVISCGLDPIGGNNLNLNRNHGTRDGKRPSMAEGEEAYIKDCENYKIEKKRIIEEKERKAAEERRIKEEKERIKKEEKKKKLQERRRNAEKEESKWLEKEMKNQ